MILQDPQPGDILGVQMPFYRHKGILLPGGRVLHASKEKGRVVVDSLEDFSEGRRVHVLGYPSRLAPDQVIARALELHGRPYRLFGGNCDHLVRHAHGLSKTSPQLNAWLAVGVVGMTAAAIIRRRSA
jgi:cell wall-associated NlpC family hydrolase